MDYGLDQVHIVPDSLFDWAPLQNWWRMNSSVDWDELENAIKQCMTAKPLNQIHANQQRQQLPDGEYEGNLDGTCVTWKIDGVTHAARIQPLRIQVSGAVTVKIKDGRLTITI